MPEQNSLAWALECSLYHDPRYFNGLFEQVFGKTPDPPPPPPTEDQKRATQDLVDEIFRVHRPRAKARTPGYIFWN